MNNATTLELVTFKTVAGTTDNDLQKAAHAVTPVLRGYRGFVSRSIARADDGTWIDSVYWKDRTAAESAANAIMQAPAAQAFFALIDQSSMVFRHAVITSENEERRTGA
jgi:hypothetical protein